jgi:predicted murein hydrolase (TIGR00659 family)
METAREGIAGLAGSSLPWIALTVAVYAAASALYRRLRTPLLHPVLFSTLFVILILAAGKIPFAVYNEGGKIVSFFLGPSVVALAVPLYRERHRILRNIKAIGITVPLGALIGLVSSVMPAIIAGAPPDVIVSLAPRSITTPIAIEVSKTTGGIPSLTAAIVVLTGISGAVIGPFVLRGLGMAESAVFGFAMGFSAHGIGTARAFEFDETSGAFSSLALCLNGVMTAVLTPPFILLLGAMGILPAVP